MFLHTQKQKQKKRQTKREKKELLEKESYDTSHLTNKHIYDKMTF